MTSIRSSRRGSRAFALIVAAAAHPVALVGCAGGHGRPETIRVAAPRTALINHVVFFDLKDPADAPALIRDCDRRLATIPGVSSYFCGRHVDTGRATVDSDYDVGFYVGFESREDYAAYVEHPAHVALVNEWRPRFESIVVRDVLDETR